MRNVRDIRNIKIRVLIMSLLVLVIGFNSACSQDIADGSDNNTAISKKGSGEAPAPKVTGEAPAAKIVPRLKVNGQVSDAGFHVWIGAKDGGDGTSWEKAYNDLQNAIEAAAAHNTKKKVYVVQGTYKPTSHPNKKGSSDEREKHFSLRNGVEVIGGYKGQGALNDPDLYKTVLSGDIGKEGETSDNVYHVFYHPDGTKLDATARLQGVTITKGNANGSVPINSSGGGMFNDYSSPRLTNCEFIGNEAFYGGGMYNFVNSDPLLVNCTFTGNEASYGGGMHNSISSDPTLVSCKFIGNVDSYWGGGMYNVMKSFPTLSSCTFTDNTATMGGAIYSDKDSAPKFEGTTKSSFTKTDSSNPDGKNNGNYKAIS